MTTRPVQASGLVRVARLDDLALNEPTPFTVAGEELMVIRVPEGVYAIGNICTHAEAYLDMGVFHAGSLEIECPLHVGRFDIRTGNATAEPCVIPVRRYEVVVDGADVLIDISAACG